ncbi:hypothetical protein PCANC_06071 [Puccinia coronata f. sp. avenae]|uniref:Uncharacterized protein n=1 Tax=Puccinia coronata f. sp. avenae TaxID=200324 RepID=A0A2N5T568_9BASI|nr:hypothetical protein PCANC_06071 [Puccinia coronata f. sp. avenae]
MPFGLTKPGLLLGPRALVLQDLLQRELVVADPRQRPLQLLQHPPPPAAADDDDDDAVPAAHAFFSSTRQSSPSSGRTDPGWLSWLRAAEQPHGFF